MALMGRLPGLGEAGGEVAMAGVEEAEGIKEP